MSEHNNNNIPLVTIITPSYNQGRFIKDTIESVLNQDYTNIEYWVIDGGSVDDTIEILKSYGNKIKWVSEKDNGQADAVNKGINLAKGSIIGWLNSDDTYLEGTISYIVNYARKHPEADMIYGEGYFIDEDSNIIDRYYTEKFDRRRLAQRCYICQPSVFLKKEIIDKVGLLDDNLDLCLDYELWMRIAKHGNVSYTAKYLATSRMYSDNKTLSRSSEVIQEACIIIYKHYGYIPLNWLYNYVLQISKRKDVFSIILYLFKLNLKYNRRHFIIILNQLYSLFINKLKKNNYKGRYDDDWISTKYKCSIKTQHHVSKIIIVGNHIWPKKDKLIVDIELDGEYIGNIELLHYGEFQKEVHIPKSKKAGKHKLKLYMSIMYTPNDYGISKDKRRLTFQLYNILLES